MKNKLVFTLLTTCSMFLSANDVLGQSAKERKILVAYYSHTGNTEVVAREIAAATGGELFEITPATSYPTDHKAVVDQAKREIEADFRPALKNDRSDLSQYDVIFVGSPNWWATIAPPVATFLANHNLRGKTIVPFITHEGSRMGRSEADIRKLASGATLLPGLPVRGGAVANSREEVRRWVAGLKW